MKPWLNVSKAAEYAGLSRGHDLHSGLRFHDLRQHAGSGIMPNRRVA
jgi:hypothetical protein